MITKPKIVTRLFVLQGISCLNDYVLVFIGLKQIPPFKVSRSEEMWILGNQFVHPIEDTRFLISVVGSPASYQRLIPATA
jgi:hypothetical protein